MEREKNQCIGPGFPKTSVRLLEKLCTFISRCWAKWWERRPGSSPYKTKRVINALVPSLDPKANPHPSDSRWSFDESHLQMRKSRTGGQDRDSRSGFPVARPAPVHPPSSETSSLMEVLLARQWEEWKLFQLQHQSKNIQWATSEHPVCAWSFGQVLQILKGCTLNRKGNHQQNEKVIYRMIRRRYLQIVYLIRGWYP